MSKAVTPNRWFQGWRASPPVAEMDPADFGTAFGLDLSMGAADLPPTPAAAPAGRRPGWVRRLAARRRPAT